MLNRGRGHESSEDLTSEALALINGDLDSRERAILDWRIECLTRAGFDELRASALAVNGDWRKAIELVENGCDHLTAADIAQ
jgi:hypothetical protein